MPKFPETTFPPDVEMTHEGDWLIRPLGAPRPGSGKEEPIVIKGPLHQAIRLGEGYYCAGPIAVTPYVSATVYTADAMKRADEIEWLFEGRVTMRPYRGGWRASTGHLVRLQHQFTSDDVEKAVQGLFDGLTARIERESGQRCALEGVLLPDPLTMLFDRIIRARPDLGSADRDRLRDDLVDALREAAAKALAAETGPR